MSEQKLEHPSLPPFSLTHTSKTYLFRICQELLQCAAIQQTISPQRWRCILWNKLRDGYWSEDLCHISSVVINKPASFFPAHCLCCNLHSFSFPPLLLPLLTIISDSVLEITVRFSCQCAHICHYMSAGLWDFAASLGKKQLCASSCGSVVEAETPGNEKEASG